MLAALVELADIASILVEPQVPDARGPVSLAVLSLLTEQVPHNHLAPVEAWLGDSDPFGIDLQLALYVCYETALPGLRRGRRALGMERRPAAPAGSAGERVPGRGRGPHLAAVVCYAVVGIDRSRNAFGITTSEPVRNHSALRWPVGRRLARPRLAYV